MKINNKYHIAQINKNKAIVTNLFDGRNKEIHPGDDNYREYAQILSIVRKRKWSLTTKNRILGNTYSRLFSIADPTEFLVNDETVVTVTTTAEDGTKTTTTAVVDKTIVKEAMNKLIHFFSEFGYAPSIRFVNTLIRSEKPAEYVMNYFTIQDHAYSKEIADKIKSPEWKSIIDTLKATKTEKSINTRMKLYYGAPGSGKTTKALSESNKCIVCSSDMLPADLMQNFAFSDGKAEFQKSDLWNAMENGETIVLDEINMLPFESLRFLQGITDGKDTLNYKGFEINIKEGFNVIGTMNLTVNGQMLSIPEPLVDRCSEIKEFTLNADTLMNAL